jgi:hypothetical protein
VRGQVATATGTAVVVVVEVAGAALWCGLPEAEQALSTTPAIPATASALHPPRRRAEGRRGGSRFMIEAIIVGDRLRRENYAVLVATADPLLTAAPV